MKDLFKEIYNEYVNEFSNIEKLFKEIKEESYYILLVNFLKNFSTSINKNFEFLILPEENKLYPDIKVIIDNNIVGYIELKKVKTDLDDIYKSSDVSKNGKIFSNLILTNYHDFILYRNGAVVKKVSLFDWDSKKLIESNILKMNELLLDFFSFIITENINTSNIDCVFDKKNRNLDFENFISISDIFKVYSMGVITGAVNLFIDFTKEELIEKLNNKIENKKYLNNSNKKYLEKLIKFYENNNQELEKYVIKCAFRPFDFRYILYDSRVIHYANMKAMVNMLNSDNIGLVVSYRKTHKMIWQDAMVCDKVNLGTFISNRARSYFFPLYLIDNGIYGIFKIRITNNIKKDFIYFINNIYKKNVEVIEIFSYIYSILYSNKYRKKYDDYLVYMLPRIPIARDYFLFSSLSKLGRQLIDIHLLKDFETDLQVKYEGSGNHTVEDFYYNEIEKKIYINREQYFTNVEPEVWFYGIGSYQVVMMYLKGRKNRNISSEVYHIIKMIQAIYETIKIQKQIDELYHKIEENLVATNNLNELHKKN